MTDTVLVAYATHYGSTQEVAESVAETLREQGLDVALQSMNKVKTLDSYRAVVLGAPLYVGRWHKDARRFLKKQQAALTDKPVAVFSLGPLSAGEKEMEETGKQLANQLSENSWLEPVATQLFVGKYDPDSLRGLHKMVANAKASPLYGTPASDNRDWDAIRAWAASLPSKL